MLTKFLRQWGESILLTKTNLQLLSGKLEKIAETPYFSHDLNQYLEQLRVVTERLLSDFNILPPGITEAMTDQIWIATKFLSGSTSKKIPYEIVHCLKKSLEQWTDKKAIITTAVTQEKGYSFYFQGMPQDFYSLAAAYTGVNFTGELVQLAFPEIYQHRPLLNVALYHELGHFLDTHHGIVNKSLLMIPYDELALPLQNNDFNTLTDQQKQEIATHHRREYFADIFAASYSGNAYKNFLKEFAGNNPVCMTHPATEDRLKLIDLFLSKQQNEIISLFQNALTTLNLIKLELAFKIPDVTEAFSNTRPYSIQNEKELHGIFEASATYLNQLSLNSDEEIDTERVINNLVEKSIRNSMTVDRWRDCGPIT